MKKILIIGESCKDIFVYCDAIRLAPDIPVPVLNVIEQKENDGMAMNVYNNIMKYHTECEIWTNPNYQSVSKTRYVHTKTNHMFIRVDSNDIINPFYFTSSLHFIETLKSFKNYDIIIISDYNKGFLSENDIEYICLNHDNVFIDTKKILGNWVSKAKYIKINDYEYNNSKNYIKDFKDKIIHTRSEFGCNFQDINYPVDKVEVKDLSGAGDSFMAALVVKYSQTEDIIESIKFANKCASEVVKHRGVTTI